MLAKRHLVDGLAWGLLLLGPGAWVAAQTPVTVSCPGGCQCIPNAKAFGYFPTRWREWPGELRPDKVFPQVIGRELVPTPPGTVVPPPPKEVVQPEPIVAPNPVPMAPLSEGGSLQSEKGAALPRNVPTPAPETPMPAMPLEPAVPLPQTPPAQDVLPAIPLEPSEAMPPLPSMEQGLPGLQSQGNPPLPTATRPEQKPTEKNKAPSKPAKPKPGEGANLVPGEAFVSSSTPQKPSPSIGRPTPNVVTRADWLAEPLARRPERKVIAGRQVVYQDLRGGDVKPTSSRWPMQLPANLPPGLNGYCPVELVENEKWVAGSRRWTATYQGRTYLLSGPEQHQRFLTNPSRYCPMLSGMDPVLAVDENRAVFGLTEFCVVYDGRLYMFSGSYSLARFRQNPHRYASAIHQSTF